MRKKVTSISAEYLSIGRNQTASCHEYGMTFLGQSSSVAILHRRSVSWLVVLPMARSKPLHCVETKKRHGLKQAGKETNARGYDNRLCFFVQ